MNSRAWESRVLVGLVWMLAWCNAAVGQEELPPAFSGEVEFARDIRPIFQKHCLRCHGPSEMKGGLRLHARSLAQEGGDHGPAWVAGKSAESLIVRYVAGLVEGKEMPPDGESLSDEEIGRLRTWIDAGAAWPEDSGEAVVVRSTHWAFQKPVRAMVPVARHAEWVRNPIDAFIASRMESVGFTPGPEAERRVLIRRLYLDVLGLPPDPREVIAFVEDERPGAYERLVDRVLASPRHGERQARRWLDRARYADTNGYEKDRARSIWPYRDWVIRAFNRDQPFDAFTIEQLAGDLLPEPTLDQLVATGFHRNTMTNEEGGIDVEEFRHAALVDRVATTGAVWLGLTIGCAQCHTHKYDPITTREYYKFLAYFNNADEPELEVPSERIEEERERVLARIAELEAGRAAHFPPGEATEETRDLSEAERRARHLRTKYRAWEDSIRPVRWVVVEPEEVLSRKGATLTLQDDGSILASGDWPNNDVYELEFGLDAGRVVTGIRIEALPDPSLPEGGPGRAPLFSEGDFILTEVEAEVVQGANRRTLGLRNATQDYSESGKPAALAIDGVPESGWSVKGGVGRAHQAVFELAEPYRGVAGERLRLVLHQFGIHQMTLGRFRISVTGDEYPVAAAGVPGEIEAALLVPRGRRSHETEQRLLAYYLAHAPELGEYNKRIEELRRGLPRHPRTLVFRERPADLRRKTHIHPRGEFLQRSAEVASGVPAVLGGAEEVEGKDRLALARWLVSGEHPLAARVVVNQVWQAYFGRGIVGTMEDFGTRGEKPTHPELLDWLAEELVAQGWSLKALQRLILTSAAYRQSSEVKPEVLAADPRNELISRAPRLRVEAEVIRDMALACAGMLDQRIGGPSVYPPQPSGVTALAYGGGGWTESEGRDRYRRGLYTFIKRTAPFAAFTTFDMPSSEVVCLRRERTNTPLQALTLLNDPMYMEAARGLAERCLREAGPELRSRIRHAYEVLLGRAARPEEEEALAGFLSDAIRVYQADTEAAGKLLGKEHARADDAEGAAWTAAMRVLINLDEFITRN